MLVVIGAVAGSAGVLTPILTYWISAKAGSAQAWQLGKQTAAASLGVTLGSAAGGTLYDFADLPGASFILTAGVAVLGFLLRLGLPAFARTSRFMLASAVGMNARVAIASSRNRGATTR